MNWREKAQKEVCNSKSYWKLSYVSYTRFTVALKIYVITADIKKYKSVIKKEGKNMIK